MLGDTNFGLWSGSVSNPRNIQIVGRFDSMALFCGRLPNLRRVVNLPRVL